MDGSRGAERVVSSLITTPRLTTHVMAVGPETGEPVCFIHGNVSSNTFWTETLEALPSRYRGLAPDLRGYGASEALPVDAIRGLRDFADDLHALFEALGLATGERKVYLVGWSMGAGIAMQYAMDHPDRVASLVLESAMSPYGFGGTRDIAGTLCWPDAAGSGGGTANPDFVKRLAEKDRGAEANNSPRVVMNSFYFKPPFRPPREQEEAYVSSMLSTVVGDGNYPGDTETSEHWPGVRPGTRGVNNALSPRFCNLSAFADLPTHPPVLWIRGDSDQIVSDTSFFDFGFLGQLGAVPGWPGAELFPPQPMVAQVRAVLEAYRVHGGAYREEVIAECGHSPHVEHPDVFQRLITQFWEEQGY